MTAHELRALLGKLDALANRPGTVAEGATARRKARELRVKYAELLRHSPNGYEPVRPPASRPRDYGRRADPLPLRCSWCGAYATHAVPIPTGLAYACAAHWQAATTRPTTDPGSSFRNRYG